MRVLGTSRLLGLLAVMDAAARAVPAQQGGFHGKEFDRVYVDELTTTGSAPGGKRKAQWKGEIDRSGRKGRK